MRPSQLLLGALVIAAFAVTFVRYWRQRIRLVDFVLWSALWAVAFVAVAFPETTAFVARLLGIGRGVDAAIYLSVVLSFYLIFRLYERIDRLEYEITTIVRHLALSDREPRR